MSIINKKKTLHNKIQEKSLIKKLNITDIKKFKENK